MKRERRKEKNKIKRTAEEQKAIHAIWTKGQWHEAEFDHPSVVFLEKRDRHVIPMISNAKCYSPRCDA
ncbi:CLUMA_CG019904, isoform A [Clunio marinus]|uniref:CLUMA_CG019904, isoform A n=1 Tax=Clunio marinus TaxID=568069 RepID=A0A1J1J234_9DIPT|nr:CLUMA_CG019904, isoform A [Clunio marinus]